MALSKEQEKWLEKIKQSGKIFKKVPKELVTEEFCLEAVRQNGYAVEHVPDAIRTEAICLEAVRQNGYAVEHVPDVIRTEALCLEAVRQNGRTLEGVPDALKTEAVCLAAVQQDRWALEYVPDAKKTEAICLEAMRNGGALCYVPEALRTEAICTAAFNNDTSARIYIPENLLAKVQRNRWVFYLEDGKDRIENHLNYHPWLRGIFDEARNIAALDPSAVLKPGLSAIELGIRANTIRGGDNGVNHDATAVPEAYFKFLYLIGGFNCRSVSLFNLGDLSNPNSYGNSIADVTGQSIRERVIVGSRTIEGRGGSSSSYNRLSYPVQLTIGRCDHGEYVYDRRYDSYSLEGFNQATHFGNNCGDMLSHAMYRARENIKENWTAPITSGSGSFGYGTGLV